MVAARILSSCLVIGGLLGSRTAAAEGLPACPGEYAEDLTALSTHARAIETATAPYSYAVRMTATYECVSYGRDGTLKKSRTPVRASGTAFGYRRDGGDTLLLTNEHVAAWPAVTDGEHEVDGVPVGCKRISDTLTIVDDDRDAYAADDISLSRVVVDPVLDIAILRAHQALEILPWRIGKSAALTARNVVEVKGFPLGAFRATNVGKVVSAHDHDVQGERDHDDFVVDALLTSGGSGSPVLALSCKTGEFELVGVFHARYKAASALNVVVSIDQVRAMMTSLQRSPRPADGALTLDSASRARLVAAVEHDRELAFFALGPLVARVHARADGTLVFTVFASDFPATTTPVLAVEDLGLPDPASFGTLGQTYVGGPGGLHRYAAKAADAEVQAVLSRTLHALRASALAAFDYRETLRATDGSRGAFDRTADRKHVLERAREAARELASPIGDLVERELTVATGTALALTDVEAGPLATTQLASMPE